jgi:hypothetical protein
MNEETAPNHATGDVRRTHHDETARWLQENDLEAWKKLRGLDRRPKRRKRSWGFEFALDIDARGKRQTSYATRGHARSPGKPVAKSDFQVPGDLLSP